MKLQWQLKCIETDEIITIGNPFSVTASTIGILGGKISGAEAERLYGSVSLVDIDPMDVLDI